MCTPPLHVRLNVALPSELRLRLRLRHRKRGIDCLAVRARVSARFGEQFVGSPRRFSERSTSKEIVEEDDERH